MTGRRSRAWAVGGEWVIVLPFVSLLAAGVPPLSSVVVAEEGSSTPPLMQIESQRQEAIAAVRTVIAQIDAAIIDLEKMLAADPDNIEIRDHLRNLRERRATLVSALEKLEKK